MVIVCKWIIVIIIIIVAVIATVTGNIIRGPEDTEAVSGSTVTLRCQTDAANGMNQIEWHFKPNDNAMFTIIYKHGMVVNVAKGNVKVAHDPVTGSYDMVISDVALSNAGVYTCMDDDSQRRADLVVFDRYPSDEFCFVNKSVDEVLGINRCLNDSDLIQISCQLRFKGNAHVHLEWRNGGGLIESNNNDDDDDGTTTTSTIKFKAEDMKSTNFSCLIKYKNDKIASNIHWTTTVDVLKITDSPVVTRGGCGLRGRNCSALGPTGGQHRCEYIWTDDKDTIVARGSYLNVADLPKGRYSCVATTRVPRHAACSYVAETLDYNCDTTREQITTTMLKTAAISDASSTIAVRTMEPLLIIIISVVTAAVVTLTLVTFTILILRGWLRRKGPSNSEEKATLKRPTVDLQPAENA